jgi:ribonuclease HI
MAEALAVRHAMSLADEEGFRKLLVVSDCLSVIHRINSVMPDRSPVGVVIQDIKALANNFSDISFSHVYRQGNEAAHILARSGEGFSSIVFKNFAPDCIRQTLCNDLL